MYRQKLAYLDQHIDELKEIRNRLAGRLAKITPASSWAFTCRPFLEEEL